MMKLKDKDEVISVTWSTDNNVLVVTKKGYGLWYRTSEINPVGIKASGVKSINLREDEVVTSKDRKVMLQNAPEKTEEYFVVPKVVD